ncbi:MAG: glycosyl hydrolase 115 family protein [Prevotella sp.]|nr:glycosyl hydrolase 115 family protein [Prevotella sp.]
MVSCACAVPAAADNVEWYDGRTAVTYNVQKSVDPVVTTALDMFGSDMQAVTGKRAKAAAADRAAVRIVEADRASGAVLRQLKKQGVPVDSLMTLTDGFHISVIGRQITVVGSNGRGTAYGMLELSRMAGVSPWIWWGDVVPERRDRLTIDDGFRTTQGASVEYRGIFINDEDWSLRPWSYGTYEPGGFGQIGPRTYKKVFQLLLRLRANAIWPGMHTGTKAFFRTEGAKAMADSCGIAIGTSHCEPLLRNNVDEWDVKERGAYNYMTNRKAVHDYWIERLKEVKGSAGGNMFTIGMRGIHDGSMEGVKTMDEKLKALQQVIDDQQELLRKYIGAPEKQTQVFVPYKEVLQIYERGLRVPDYVTLMWCDDNYGYMTRLSDAAEQRRSGGGGIYYHLSYWGRPHDYLWLTTTQPGLIYNEMREAYDHNVRKVWIVNVHDPKVAGYDMELFLDMAWNIDCVSPSTIAAHYRAWLCRQFGREAGERLFPAMHEFYRLCGERRPEFMGWSQTELDKKTYARGLSPVVNTEFSTTAFGGELDRYLERYADVARTVREAKALVRPELRDAYFAAIEYPVLAADAHARKMLESQRARQYATGSTLKDMFASNAALYTAVARSQSAYQEIRKLTEYYNETMAGGKWRRSMNMRPRDLPVCAAPSLPTLLSDKEVSEWLGKDTKNNQRHDIDTEGTIARNACDYTKASAGARTVQMLGHSMNAVAIPKDGTLTYEFTAEREGKAVLRTAMIPTQPNDDGDLRYSVSIDGGEPKVYTLKEKFRSEGWKQNVLRGQAVRELPVDLTKGRHTLTIKALDSHIIADQWMIDYKPQRKHYLFPVK